MANHAMFRCFLEGFLDDGETAFRIPLSRFPALIGREAGIAVSLHSHTVSRRHAEITRQNGQLLLRDLGSRNGTFLNHERVTDAEPIAHGDVLRFGDVELRLQMETAPAATDDTDDFTKTEFFGGDASVDRMPIGAKQLDQLLREHLIRPVYQPLLSTEGGRIRGLELLGRGRHQQLPELPMPLFNLASSVGRSIELSEIIRDVGIDAWVDAGLTRVPLFVNTHPQELRNCRRLIESLERVRARYPNVPLVLEIHEQAVTDQDTLSQLNDALARLQIDLAYDDFGAGQARLLELLDVPPYAVKFDISLIQNLDKASPHRQEMIGLLVALVKKGNTSALAEGVSNVGELSACRSLGFDLIQGFVYGQPLGLEELAASPLW